MTDVRECGEWPCGLWGEWPCGLWQEWPCELWGDWPSWLRYCNQNRKVPG